MNNNITIQTPTTNCSKICEKILRALPDWFGIEDSLVQYVKDAEIMPTMVAKDDDVDVGFLIIKRHFKESAEIHCMGILPQYHKKGIGKLLIKELEKYLIDNRVKFLQVKTVSADCVSSSYTNTRAFYKAVRFIPLEIFPDLWDKTNPCLLLVKQI